ncbi:MAG TPA: molybdopterin dinucleotide binding domain-containing protein, partial [Solirubrobacteraceae bacterium]|nr:molybdopterin dinucleotide binding domain-containing protein [Solirubrobacteraceae bacterium]
FDAILTARSGVVFTVDEYEDDFGYITHVGHRFALEIPELLRETDALHDATPGWTSDEFPFVLSAGERRAYTANDIFRDAAWRKRDPDGALRLSPADAQTLGLASGDRARVTTARGSAETVVEVSDAMQAGHASLPNGFGLDITAPDGTTSTTGVAPNRLTSSDWRDPFAGTPWHKHVPARIEPAAAGR